MRILPTRLWPRFLKRRLPTSLWGRALLIIILPTFVMQVAVTWAFFDAHWQTVTARLSEGLAGDIAWAVESYKADPTPRNLDLIAARAQASMQLSIALLPGRPLPERHRPAFWQALDRTMTKALDNRLDDPYWFDTTRYPAYVEIRVKTGPGTLRIFAPRDRAFATRGHIFVLWLTGATLILMSIAILFIRNQVRAIERLAMAADAFGRGVEAPFKPHGAREVRQAANAFLDMKSRIQRHLEQRTALLASVSHDLRTPLTRLKLELALAEPGTQTAAMRADLSEMEHMIDEYLAFAQGEAGEATTAVNLFALATGVAEGARRTGANVEVEGDESLEAIGRRNALRRILDNLVANAAAHAGHVVVRVTPRATGGTDIVVDDDGPGIAPAAYEEAFKPFSRLDDARNQNRKGVGLGLAIARDGARAHGGDVVLSPSPLGGLRATVVLPG